MLNVIVTWVWLQVMMISCPQLGPVPDEYGRHSQSFTSNLSICTETIRVKKGRVFKNVTNMDGVYSFITRGKKQKDLSDFEVSFSWEPGIIE